MKLSPEWIMAIIAIIALISPLTVAIVDNLFKYKKKKYNEKKEALLNFSNLALNAFNNKTVNYDFAKNNLYIHFPNVDTNLINKLDKYKAVHDEINYKATLILIIKTLSP